MIEPEKIEVPTEHLEDVVLWWRSAHEAPGGCSAQDALDGMRTAVWSIALLLRENGIDV